MTIPPRPPPVLWDDITRAAASALAAVAPALPPPASAVAAVAAAMAHALTDLGCAVLGGCDEADAGPQPADIPTGEAGRDAMSRLRARAAGLDRRGIEERQRSDADEVLLSARQIAGLRAAAKDLGPTVASAVDMALVRHGGRG